MEANSNAHHICLATTQLISEKGFDNVSMADIAHRAALTEGEVFTCFGNKQDIVLFLYQSVNTDWLLSVNDISEKKLADRFERCMIAKVELIQPYLDILGDMMGLLLRNSRIGVNSPRTSHIRAMGMQAMQRIIDGAADSKGLKKKLPSLPSLLYTIHWGVLFLNIQSNNKEQTIGAIKLISKMLGQAGNLSFLLSLSPFFSDISQWTDKLLTEGESQNYSTDREILKVVFNNRKVLQTDKECTDNKCEECMRLHEEKVHYFTQQNKPVHFILPAFPAKSPNRNKVLGSLPDLGEEIALTTLEDMCREIKNVYAPGAYITICSDGRIFSELVEVSDELVTEYVQGIKELIAQMSLQYISIVNLEDLMKGKSFDQLRSSVIATYAEPIEDLEARLKSSNDFKGLFNGMHRFITDDRKVLHPENSGTKTKQESASIALRVIQYSNAWTRFLAYVYPDAVRLSIHPYPAHNSKIGIQLTKATDNWITPWHGVIVLQKDGYVLMKKNEAEERGARLVTRNGRPHHYTLIDAL